MGIPANTQLATTPTKKMTRLRRPKSSNKGLASQKVAALNVMPAKPSSACLALLKRTSRKAAKIAISTMPVGKTAARQALEISSAGVALKASFEAYSQAGQATNARKARQELVANSSSKAARELLALLIQAVMRMCSPRRKTNTEPCMARQRNDQFI